MLLESRLELVVKVYCNSRTMTEKSKTGTISDVLRKEIKWNHKKMFIWTIKGRKCVENKNRNKE